MATNGRLSILYVNPTLAVTTAGTAVTMTGFIPVKCLTGNNFDGTTSAIGTSSKCSPNGFSESIDGEKSWTMSGEGQAYSKAVGETATVKNHNDLFKLWRSGAPAWWMIAEQIDGEDSPTIRYGVGRIDSHSDAFPNNDLQTFTTSITGIGEAFDQDDLDVTP